MRLVNQAGIARSMADAPDIDGLVYLAESDQLQSGDMVTVRIEDTDEHDMWARLVD